jgi:general secretion pathway protein D
MSSKAFKKSFKASLSVLMLALFVAQNSQAQFDDFDEEPPPPPGMGGGRFSPPSPPPPPLPSGSSGGFENTSAGNAKANAEASSVLTKKQRDKFAKAGIEDITNENFPEIIESFDFVDANLTDIVKAISELTGKNFIIDQGVRGKITIVAPSKITVAEAYKAFLSALAINGFALVPSGGFMKIRSARNSQRDSIETFSGAYYPNADQMITRIIHLKHISAEQINSQLRILTSKDGELSAYPATNSLIVSDFGSNIDRIMKIISQLDVPGFEDQLEVIPVRYAKAKDLADLIDKIVNKGQPSNQRQGGTFSSGVPRFSRAQSQNTQGSAYYMVIPDDRTNSLIVVGNKAGIARIRKLLAQLDFRIRPEDAGGVYVYYVKNGDAEKIAQTLSGIAKDAGPKPPTSGGPGGAPSISPVTGVSSGPQEIFGGDVKITADKGTNSLVVVASKQDYEVVLNLLAKIDIPRDQVYVEAVIMEMRMSDSFNYQVGFFKFNEGAGKAGFNSFSSQSLSDLIFNPAGGQGAVLGFGSNDKVTISAPGQPSVTVNSVLGLVNFLKKTQNANVLSTPQILALDNQEALIEVGDKVVTGSQTTPGTNGAQSIKTPTFEDALISLKIKPFISPTSDTIRMEIKNSVTQIGTASTPEAFKSETQPLAKRKIETNIVVRNGDTAVLGGLMKDDQKEEVFKVPLLGDIPIIGWLFKSRQSTLDKTNMVIFLTPKIIRSSNDANKLLGKKIDDRLEYLKSIGGRDPFGATIDKLRSQQVPGQGTSEIKK